MGGLIREETASCACVLFIDLNKSRFAAFFADEQGTQDEQTKCRDAQWRENRTYYDHGSALVGELSGVLRVDLYGDVVAFLHRAFVERKADIFVGFTVVAIANENGIHIIIV